MPQSGGVPAAARAGEFLRLVASFHTTPLDPGALLERLGLTDRARTPYRRMSGGQQQRLSLAVAVVGRPELVFLDEPTAGLDPQARHATWELIGELRAAGVSVVLTTHHMDEAERLADRVVIIDRGRVVAEGTPERADRRRAAAALPRPPRASASTSCSRRCPPGAPPRSRPPGTTSSRPTVGPSCSPPSPPGAPRTAS